jgi:D-alanyl-D-alanine carboxypeptidase/D-alanyl-D-alanine-endopeptidase (penicillin-binding protein 4)
MRQRGCCIRHDGGVQTSPSNRALVTRRNSTHRRLVRTLAGLSAIAIGFALAPSTPASARPELSATDSAIRAGVRAQAGQLPGVAGIRIADAESGRFIYGRSIDEPLLPASTMKLVTAVTSLATLGADHRFTTSVVRGDQRDDVVLVGGGDPMLTAEELGVLARRTAKKLLRTGVTDVDVSLDDSLYPSPTNARGWLGADIPTYAAPVRALGMLSDYSMDTAANAAYTFVGALEAAGVDASYIGRDEAADGAASIAKIRPNTLGDAVDLMLVVSENNVAEQLFRQVAVARAGSATWGAAAREAAEVLEELGLPLAGVDLADGSGLSSDDRLTPRLLTGLLRLIADPANAELHRILAEGWLPVSGQTGTLTRRFTGSGACAIGDVFAKTGSLTGVQTLAGFTRGADGRWKVFAIMLNRAYADGRQVIDRIAAEVHGCV